MPAFRRAIESQHRTIDGIVTENYLKSDRFFIIFTWSLRAHRNNPVNSNMNDYRNGGHMKTESRTLLLVVFILMFLTIPLVGANASSNAQIKQLKSTKTCSACNLSGANLSKLDLSGANLSKSNLSGANLSESNLNGANLSESNLSRANLSGAKLNKTNFSGSNLSEAIMNKADLSGTILTGSNLNGVTWNDGAKCKTPSIGQCNK